jgi:hypothetical protein
MPLSKIAHTRDVRWRLYAYREQCFEDAVGYSGARQMMPSPSAEKSNGIAPDYRCASALVRWRWVLGSQSRPLVMNCILPDIEATGSSDLNKYRLLTFDLDNQRRAMPTSQPSGPSADLNDRPARLRSNQRRSRVGAGDGQNHIARDGERRVALRGSHTALHRT